MKGCVSPGTERVIATNRGEEKSSNSHTIELSLILENHTHWLAVGSLCSLGFVSYITWLQSNIQYLVVQPLVPHHHQNTGHTQHPHGKLFCKILSQNGSKVDAGGRENKKKGRTCDWQYRDSWGELKNILCQSHRKSTRIPHLQQAFTKDKIKQNIK